MIAMIVITHESQPPTTILVRNSGHNPALVSVDGRNYFYAELHDDAPDGALQLYRVVQRFETKKQ